MRYEDFLEHNIGDEFERGTVEGFYINENKCFSKSLSFVLEALKNKNFLVDREMGIVHSCCGFIIDGHKWHYEHFPSIKGE